MAMLMSLESMISSLFRLRCGVKYCDERGYLFVRVSVSLRVCPHAYLKNHIAKLHQFFANVVCGRGSSGIAIRYVLPVLLITPFCSGWRR